MRFLWVIFPLVTLAEESFISHYEYGEMLYKNPRGVSCTHCHGEYGEKKVIVKYKDKYGKQHAITGSDIRQASLKEMVDSMESYHEVMPRYYLTKSEIKAIYDYLKKNR